jgi:2-methylisocitrate lyase-like PEP mutase family enzyme
MPIGGRATELLADVQRLRQLAEQKGRDPRTVSVTVFGAPADPAVLAQYRAAGVERVSFGLPPADRDKVLPLMDRYAAVARQLE